MILLLAGCAALAAPAFASGGSGSGGGSTSINPLPSTPPSPDIVLRESFGPGLDPGMSGYYELRAGGQVLSSGSVVLDGFNPVSLVIDPVARTVSAKVNGIDLGTFAAPVSPGYLALEGQGWADDVIVRSFAVAADESSAAPRPANACGLELRANLRQRTRAAAPRCGRTRRRWSSRPAGA